MKLASKLLSLLQRITETVGIFFLLVIAVLMFYAVIGRYFFGTSLSYTMPIMVGSMAWFVFLLFGSVSRKDEHIRIGAAVGLVLRKRAKAFCTALENILALPLCIYLCWAGYRLVTFRMEKGGREYFGQFNSYPDWIPVLIVPIGFGIAALFYLERSVNQVRALLLRRREKQDAEDDISEEDAGITDTALSS